MFNATTVTLGQLGSAIKNGARVVVTCKKAIEDLEGYPEAGMRATLVDARVKHSDCLVLTFDYTAFDEFNKQFESPNYYDKDQNPRLTAREKGVYTLKEDLYADMAAIASDVFEFVLPAQLELMARHKESAAPGQSYVAWLEQELLAVAARDGSQS